MIRLPRPIAPTLLLVETANVLLKYERSGGLKLEIIEASMFNLGVIVRELIDDRSLLPAAMRISAANKHKIYDCLYLALALERREPLATADKRLAALARSLGISVELIEPA